MTLYIKVLKCESPLQSGELYVQGSSSGLLVSPKITSSKHQFKPVFRIICSNKDHIKIKLCQNKEQFLKGDYVAMNELFVPILVKINDKKLNLDDDFLSNSSANVVDLQLEKNATLKNSTNANSTSFTNPTVFGTLTVDITYDRSSFFMGQFIQSVNPLSLVKAGRDKNKDSKYDMEKIRKVQMYKGKCETKNLFSMLDPGAEGQRTKFIESIYQDDKQVISARK